MRHAKAEPFAATDHERALTDRGRRDAVQAGVHLASIGVVPDYAMVSPAARTVGTWEAVALGSRSAAEVVIEDLTYDGSTDKVLEALRAVPLDAEVVLIVGHNPTVSDLAHLLNDGEGDDDALREMAHGYPAGALTVLEFAVPWSELDTETGTVTHFHVGRG